MNCNDRLGLVRDLRRDILWVNVEIRKTICEHWVSPCANHREGGCSESVCGNDYLPAFYTNCPQDYFECACSAVSCYRMFAAVVPGELTLELLTVLSHGQVRARFEDFPSFFNDEVDALRGKVIFCCRDLHGVRCGFNHGISNRYGLQTSR